MIINIFYIQSSYKKGWDTMEQKKEGKFKLKTPHTYAILMFIILVAWLMTYIIPAGEYVREKKNGQTLVVSGTYHTISSEHINFLNIFRAIPEGLISGGEIVFYVFLVGGAFGIVHKVGS